MWPAAYFWIAVFRADRTKHIGIGFPDSMQRRLRAGFPGEPPSVLHAHHGGMDFVRQARALPQSAPRFIGFPGSPRTSTACPFSKPTSMPHRT